ncbi:hypothetical protein PIIN_11660 [Serendipita indica DSM 11827]|uniref:Uncharacterized protein n=1 Tax=Serendipita indica (strain DSM 11827) TaxID=1109443 RepID=G4U289_SERID|nr:hypothetical protein PIIN_11660 [Serendipita indica DSM 11827]
MGGKRTSFERSSRHAPAEICFAIAIGSSANVDALLGTCLFHSSNTNACAIPIHNLLCGVNEDTS